MPILDRHVCHTHANLPISLWSTISLTFALSYLQVIYAISFVARPFWSSNLDFPPFRQAIERAEKFAIDIILEIVPTSQYRSPAPTNVIDDAIRQPYPFGLNRSNPAVQSSPRVVTSHSTNPLPSTIPRCYPETRDLHLSPKQKEIQTETVRSTHTERVTKTGDSGASIHGTGRKATTSTQPKLSTMFERPQQHTSQPAEPKHGTISSNSAFGAGGPVTTTVTEEDKHEEEQITVHTTIVEISQPTVTDPVMDISQPSNQAAPVRDMPKPSVPMENSPADSFDGPAENELGTELNSASSRYTDNTSSLSLDAGHAAKSHSTESYPGKFPVSDGMEYSSLATAEYAFRERGTTSVRPFSDY